VGRPDERVARVRCGLRRAGEGAFVEQYLPALLDGDYLTDFGLDRCVEELEAVERSAGHAGTPHPLTSTVADVHRAALRRYGPVDGELMAAAWLEEQAGAHLRHTDDTRA
jgi:3-hydroxyisobutyrate dehydrogenase